MGSFRELVAGVCEMFANELIKIIVKMKSEKGRCPSGYTQETGKRIIYEFKVLYKSKSH
jgi:hypothetical protein